MLLVLCLILFVAWILGFAAFHVAGGLIHILVVGAVVMFLVFLWVLRQLFGS